MTNFPRFGVTQKEWLVGPVAPKLLDVRVHWEEHHGVDVDNCGDVWVDRFQRSRSPELISRDIARGDTLGRHAVYEAVVPARAFELLDDHHPELGEICNHSGRSRPGLCLFFTVEGVRDHWDGVEGSIWPMESSGRR